MDFSEPRQVIAAQLISRVSSIVACLIILSVQVLPLPETLSMPDQDFSILMWTQHLRHSLQEENAVVNQLIEEIRAFYERTPYKPYSFQNGTQVLWQGRGPAQAQNSMRTPNKAASSERNRRQDSGWRRGAALRL